MPKAKLNFKTAFYWQLWSRLNSKDRPRSDMGGLGPISNTATIELLKLYNMYTQESFEMIEYIENRMYPWIVEQQRIEAKIRAEKQELDSKPKPRK